MKEKTFYDFDRKKLSVVKIKIYGNGTFVWKNLRFKIAGHGFKLFVPRFTKLTY